MIGDMLTRPATAGTGHANFGRLLTSEWTKLRTVRSTVWSFVALIVVVIGLTGLTSWGTVATWSSAPADQKAQLAVNPVAQLLGFSLFLGQAAVCVLGVLVATSEYSTGMIRSTLLASPHRLRMLAAKCVVFIIPAFLVSEAISFASYELGAAIISSKVHTSLSDPHVLRAVFGVGLYLAVLALFALAIGQLIRHTAGAISTALAAVLLLQPLATLLPGTIGKHVSAYLPTNAGQEIVQIVPSRDQLLTAWQGFAVFGLWTAVLLALAAWLLVKRDA